MLIDSSFKSFIKQKIQTKILPAAASQMWWFSVYFPPFCIIINQPSFGFWVNFFWPCMDVICIMMNKCIQRMRFLLLSRFTFNRKRKQHKYQLTSYTFIFHLWIVAMTTCAENLLSCIQVYRTLVGSRRVQFFWLYRRYFWYFYHYWPNRHYVLALNILNN